MSSPEHVVRRATLDDLGQLTELWGAMRLPPQDLSRRVTEFQVATDSNGKLLGAVGLQMADRQGLIHSEGFHDFGLAEPLRERFWERINTLATNHGLLRLWTCETAPFWGQCGLQPADADALQKLPAIWNTSPATWRTLKLRDDVDALVSADQEFMAFMAAEKARTARRLERAKMFKSLAALVAFGLLMLVIFGVIFLVRNNPRLLHR